MKKYFLIAISAILIFLLSACSFSEKDFDYYSDINNIKGEDFICESTSPDDNYTVKAYLNNGSATVDFAVLCTVTDNLTDGTI